MVSEKLGSYYLIMNLNTEGKSVWDLYQENFLVDFWDFPSIFNDDEDTEDTEVVHATPGERLPNQEAMRRAVLRRRRLHGEKHARPRALCLRTPHVAR